jgi:hypothetical protein
VSIRFTGHVLDAEPHDFSPKTILRAVLCVVVLSLSVGTFLIWVVWPSESAGDPGGQVMNQLTPAASSLPGYGTSALPWVGQIPSSLGAPYIIKMEPYRDSCDGRAGTQGWSQVVVQSGFRWEGDLSSLVAHMEPRLGATGWMLQSEPAGLASPGAGWTKTLKNGTPASLNVSEEEPGYWELVAEGEPIGGAASGC